MRKPVGLILIVFFGLSLNLHSQIASKGVEKHFGDHQTKQVDDEVRLIADWEPKKEIYIGFRTWEMGEEFEYATIQMIRSLSLEEKVKVIVQDSSLLPEGKNYFADLSCDTANISIVFEEETYFWIRDPGPIFYQKGREIGVADFRFGYYLNLNLDTILTDQIPMEKYDQNFATRYSLPTIASRLSVEGGGFETNGQGTVILVESVMLKRNPGWTKEAIEEELRTNFGVKTVIWLPKGLVEDPYYMGHLYENFFGFGTGGHSDEFVRFVNDSTIFLAWEFSDPHPDYPIREINIERMSLNNDILENTIDWRGKSFNIVKIPIPEIFYKVEELDESAVKYLQQENEESKVNVGDQINIVACASYLNYLIYNSFVVIPKYWSYSVPEIQREKDSLVLSLFEKYYPDREVVQINPLVLNYAGGGMHCVYFTIPQTP